MRFTNVTIPKDSTIAVANLTVVSTFTAGTSTKTNIQANDVDDAVNPTDQTDFDAKVMTSAAVAWDDVNMGDPVGGTYVSPDFSAVIREIINRGSWASGNALAIYNLDDGSSGNDHYGYAAFDEASTEAQLHVEYS